VEEIKRQAGGEEQFYIKYNTSQEQEPRFRESVAINLRLTRLMEQKIGPKEEPSEADVEQFYRDHIGRYMAPPQVRVSHILKSLDHGANLREAYDKMHELRQQLLAGADFAAAADAHSHKPGQGGDLGTFSRGELVEEFEAVVFSMNVGEISPVFVTPYGYHLAKVVERKDAEPYPLDQIRDQVREQCREERHQQKMRDYIETLKATAVIEEVEDVYQAPGHEHAASAGADGRCATLPMSGRPTRGTWAPR
jgi:parvulin-like peptidyl-prolyl isomerase